jgi:hypothetical protein
MRAFVLAGAMGLTLLFFVVAPVASRILPAEHTGTEVSPATAGSARASGVARGSEITPARTVSVVELHLGPSADYVVLGTLPRNAPLEVVGRDESGGWLAVSVAPSSRLYAWIPRSSASSAPANDALPLVPVRELPQR